jgi:hypothetical protein
MTVNLPAQVQTVSLAGHPSLDSVLKVNAVPTGRSYNIVGGTSPKTSFEVPDISQINGALWLLGNPASDNHLHLVLPTTKGVKMTASASSSLVSVVAGGAGHLVRHSNLRYRTYEIHGAADTVSDFTLLPNDPYDIIHIYSVGVAGSLVKQRVTSCDSQSVVVIHLQGPGTHEVTLGDLANLQSLQCTIQVFGETDPNQISSIIVDGSADPRSNRWDFTNAGSFVLSGINANQAVFLCSFSNVDRIIMGFGTGDNDVTMYSGTLGIETVLSFPEGKTYGGRMPANNVRIEHSTNTVFVNGTVKTLTIGPTSTASSIGTRPFANIDSTIVLVTDATSPLPAELILASGSGPLSPSQSFYMDSTCINPTDTGVETPAAMTTWMCAIATSHGVSCTNKCHFTYAGTKMNVLVNTGGSKDSFVGHDVAVPVNVDLGDDSDTLVWSQAQNAGVAVFNLGLGADTATLFCTSSVTLDLGDDLVQDNVIVQYTAVTPSIYGLTIKNAGPFASSSIVMSNLYEQDRLKISRIAPPASCLRCCTSDITVRSDPTVLSLTEPKTHVTMDMQVLSTYSLISCAADVFVTLEASSDGAAANDAWVYASLDKYDQKCTVAVNSVASSKGIAGFKFVQTSGLPTLHENKQTTEYQTLLTIDQFTMTAKDVDSLDVDAKIVNNFDMEVDGTAVPMLIQSGANSNLRFVNTPSVYLADITVTGDNVLIINSTVLSTDLVVDQALIKGTLEAASYSIHLPSVLHNIAVIGHPANDTTMHLLSVPLGRDVKFNGGACSRTDVIIPNANVVLGPVHLNGDVVCDNFLDVVVPVMSAMVGSGSPSSLSVVQDGVNVLVSHVNFLYRTYDIQSSIDVASTFTVLPTASDEVVHVKDSGVKGLECHVINVTGCDSSSTVLVHLPSLVDYNVILGDVSNLVNLQCTIQIIGLNDSAQISTITVDAVKDSRNLRYGFDHVGTLSVSNTDQNSNPFVCLFENIKRIVTNFGTGNNDVDVVTGTKGTEMLFLFPNVTDNMPVNVIRVNNVTNTIAITGTVKTLNIGPVSPYSELMNGTRPFDAIHAHVVLVTDVQPTDVVLDSAHGPLAPSQSFYMDSTCINPANEIIVEPSAMTTWMCAIATSHGVSCTNKCHFTYAGTKMNVYVRTGGSNDSFVGQNVAVPVNVDLGDGSDTLVWSQAQNAGVAVFNLGLGADTATLFHTSSVTLDLGDDLALDTVNIQYDVVCPSISNTTVSPIGSGSVVMKHWDSNDILNIARVAGTVTQAQVATIETSVLGAVINIDAQTSTRYNLLGCSEGTKVKLTELSVLNNATSTSLYNMMTSFTSNCVVEYVANRGSGSVAGFDVQTSSIPSIILSDVINGTGSMICGGSVIHTVGLDHTRISGNNIE